MIALALLLAAAAPPAATPAEAAARFQEANGLYLGSDFEGAARAYEQLAAEGWDGPDLRHNMGNALLRLGRRGRAIASYERALRLDPSDADARANLEIARAANVDRLVGAAERSFAERVVRRTSDGSAAAGFAAAWILLWSALAFRRRAAGRRRALLSAAAVVAAIASIAAGTLLAGKILQGRTPAAIVSATVTAAREGPSRTLRPAFELHEGTRVRLLEARDDVVRVRLANGLEGWVPAEDLEPI